MQTEVEAPGPEPLAFNRRRRFRRRKAFGRRGALDGVDLRATAGEVVAVVGPSGCGG